MRGPLKKLFSPQCQPLTGSPCLRLPALRKVSFSIHTGYLLSPWEHHGRGCEAVIGRSWIGASDWSVGCGAGPAGDGLVAWRLQVGSATTGRGFKAQVETSFLGPGKVIEGNVCPFSSL